MIKFIIFILLLFATMLFVISDTITPQTLNLDLNFVDNHCFATQEQLVTVWTTVEQPVMTPGNLTPHTNYRTVAQEVLMDVCVDSSQVIEIDGDYIRLDTLNVRCSAYLNEIECDSCLDGNCNGIIEPGESFLIISSSSIRGVGHLGPNLHSDLNGAIVALAVSP